MTSYDERQAAWTKGEQERTAKVGEVRGKVTRDIKKDADMRVRIDKIEDLRFFSAIDLKNGDSIRITIEKV